MNREEIVQAVQSYIRNENEKYALLINGAWGSGKTFLYENYLCDAISDIEVGKNERKKNVYISLYGISTIETLSKQLMTNYLVYVKANGNEIVKKGAKPVAGFLGIVSDYLDEADLVSSARSIEARCEREKIYNKEQIQSTGVAYSELRNWRYMDDDLIRDGIQRMIVELKENKYAYPVYSNIIELLLLFSKMGLYEGDLSEVQTIMLSLVENDMRVQDENRSPISFRDEDAKHKYLEVYQPIAESRKKRNEILDKGKIEEENIYDNAEAFLQHCHKREEYYCTHKSFMEYIDVEKLIKLINCSKLEGVYKIADAFDTIYYMGNVRDFYMNDIDGLKLLKERLKKVDSKGITRKCAIEYLISKIDKILVGLGVGDENE